MQCYGFQWVDSTVTVPMNSVMNDFYPASGQLAHLGLLRFAGPDAASFLQGQISNDTRALSNGTPLFAAYSTPQGRVAALLHLLPHSSGLVAVMPREVVLPTLERMRKFVMRAKVQIEDIGARFSVGGMHGAEALAAHGLPVPGSPAGYVERDGIGVGGVTPSPGRYWVIGPRVDRDTDRAADADAQAIEHAWRLADIRAGVPQVYAATREMFVAQMLNLDRIGGISFSKGCYTGQEIIARTQNLGRIKRRLFRLRLPAGSWAIGQALDLLDGRSGRLTELAPTDAGIEALAVLNIEAAAPTVMPVDAVELPLPYTLAQPEFAQ